MANVIPGRPRSTLKNMMQSEFQDRHDKSIFTNDISLILDEVP